MVQECENCFGQKRSGAYYLHFVDLGNEHNLVVNAFLLECWVLQIGGSHLDYTKLFLYLIFFSIEKECKGANS